MLTWTAMERKFVRLSRDNSPATLTQGQEDMNTGYHMFNAKFGRYFSRKQQFADVTAGQSIYQTPIDSVRIIGMTVMTGAGTNTYSPPIKEIRSEEEWRRIKTVPNYSSSWITYYYVLGDDEIEVWPIPSTTISNGIRFYYQQQDHDLSVEDIVSTTLAPVQTVTVTNGSTTVTSTGATFTNQLIGLSFQLTGVTDLSWYQIVDVPNSSTLTLKSAFVGPSASSLAFRIGQTSILPQEYQDVPIHYALGLFFSGKGNEARAQFHLGTEDKPGMYYSMVNAAVQEYSLSTAGNVISDDERYVSSWMLTPVPGTTP